MVVPVYTEVIKVNIAKYWLGACIFLTVACAAQKFPMVVRYSDFPVRVADKAGDWQVERWRGKR